VSGEVFEHDGRGLGAWVSLGGVEILHPDFMVATIADKNNAFLGLGSDAVHGPTLSQEEAQECEDDRGLVTLVADFAVGFCFVVERFGDTKGSLRRLANLGKVGHHRMGRIQLFPGYFSEAEDHDENVTEFEGNFVREDSPLLIGVNAARWLIHIRTRSNTLLGS
jgi:hypothetical protein